MDPWQGSYLCSRLRALGVPIVERPQQGARLVEQAVELTNVFRERRIDIPNNGDLTRELKRLRIEEKNYGCRIVSDRTTQGTATWQRVSASAWLCPNRCRAVAS